MPNEQTDAERAVHEAARTVAEASRRTTERAQEATRTLLDQSTELTRNLFSSWVASNEAAWRAASELQNAQVRAGLVWWQSLADGSRAAVQVFQQWDEVARQAQQAGLETFRASARSVASTAEQAASGAERAARPQR